MTGTARTALRRTTALLLAIALGSGVAAQTLPPAIGFSDTGQPAQYQMRGVDFVVRGYRGATWGMTPDQVRAAIRHDFPDARIAAERTDPVLRTTVLVATLPRLAPGPGRAFVGYVFGARTGRLIQVNLDWSVDTPTPADRAALIAAGADIVATFAGCYWALGTVTRGAAIGPRTLILFAGSGVGGGAVDVRLDGVPYTLRTPPAPGGGTPDPAAARTALLHVSFAKTADQPDITAIKPGDF